MAGRGHAQHYGLQQVEVGGEGIAGNSPDYPVTWKEMH